MYRIELDRSEPLLVGRHEPMECQRESCARVQARFLVEAATCAS